MHSIFKFKKLIQYLNIRKNFFCTDNDTKKIAKCVVERFFINPQELLRVSKEGKLPKFINEGERGTNKVQGDGGGGR